MNVKGAFFVFAIGQCVKNIYYTEDVLSRKRSKRGESRTEMIRTFRDDEI